MAPKRGRDTAGVDPEPATKRKRTSTDPGPVHEQRYETEDDDGEHSGILSTRMKLTNYLDYQCCTRIVAEIMLQMKGDTKPTEAGYIVAYLVDKTIRPPKGRAYWVRELLEMEDIEPHDETVPKDYRRALSDDRIVFIDTLKLDDEFRGRGIAQMALAGFHELVQDHLETTTIVLSPARSGTSKWLDKQGRELSDVEIENKLIASYQKSGYEVWIQGDPDVEGSITTMGIELEEH